MPFRLDRESGKLVKFGTADWPTAIAIDAKGELHMAYSVDPGYGGVWESVVGKATPSGNVEQIHPKSRISGMAADGEGNIYVAAADVWKLHGEGGNTLLNGAEFGLDPQGIAVNGRGQMRPVSADRRQRLPTAMEISWWWTGIAPYAK